MRILVTAFDGFGAVAENPSEKLLKTLTAPGHELTKVVLPTIYGAAEARLTQTIKECNPDLILLLGYSKAAAPIKLELVARNRNSQIARDNLGKIGRLKIRLHGPEQIGAMLPIEDIAKAWDEAGIVYKQSRNAGGFLCNHIFYLALEWLARNNSTAMCGFIHIGRKPQDILEAKRALAIVFSLV